MGVYSMEKRELITGTIGITLIIIGIIILAIVPDASTRFFLGAMISFLGIIILGYTIKKK